MSVTLVKQHVMRMRRIVLSFVACLLCHVFPGDLVNGMIFEKKKKLNIRTNQDMIINVHRPSCTASVILVNFNES